jgi:hypothetical protein
MAMKTTSGGKCHSILSDDTANKCLCSYKIE